MIERLKLHRPNRTTINEQRATNFPCYLLCYRPVISLLICAYFIVYQLYMIFSLNKSKIAAHEMRFFALLFNCAKQISHSVPPFEIPARLAERLFLRQPLSSIFYQLSSSPNNQ